jgi:hypothetical protein
LVLIRTTFCEVKKGSKNKNFEKNKIFMSHGD